MSNFYCLPGKAGGSPMILVPSPFRNVRLAASPSRGAPPTSDFAPDSETATTDNSISFIELLHFGKTIPADAQASRSTEAGGVSSASRRATNTGARILIHRAADNFGQRQS